MIVNAYLKVTPKQWEEIKEKYVESNMYHILSNSKRKNKRCDDCGAYCPCSSYEGYCLEYAEVVEGSANCEAWHEL